MANIGELTASLNVDLRGLSTAMTAVRKFAREAEGVFRQVERASAIKITPQVDLRSLSNAVLAIKRVSAEAQKAAGVIKIVPQIDLRSLSNAVLAIKRVGAEARIVSQQMRGIGAAPIYPQVNIRDLSNTVLAMKRVASEAQKLKATLQEMGTSTKAIRTQPVPKVPPIDTSKTEEGFRRTKREMGDYSNAAKNAKDISTQFNDDLLKFGRTLASFAAVFYTLKNAFRVFAVGIEFNKVMEDTRISLTGLVASMYEYRDANGNVMQGMAAYEAAQKDVIGLQQEMRVAGLLTAATYTELMEAMQQAFAPAKNAGVALGQMVPFVQRLTQVAQTAGVPMHMLNEEVRSFTTGAMTRRTTRIMPFMEEIGLTNKKIKEFIASGTLFEETMKRTEQIALMAAASVNTWTVALSNLYDWFQNIMGVGLESTFRELVALFLEMTDYIGRINEETGKIEFNQTFLDSIQSIDQTFRNALISVRNFAVELAKFQQAHPVLTELLVDVGGIGVKLLALGLIIRSVVGIFGLLGRGALGGLKNLGSVIANVAKYLLMLLPSFTSIKTAVTSFTTAMTRFGVIRTLFTGLLQPILAISIGFGKIVSMLGVVLLVVGKVILVLAGLSAILALFGNYTIPNVAAKLWDWIKSWEVLGVTVGDAIGIATAYLNKFVAYLFGINLYDVFGALGDFFKKDLPNILDSARTFFSGFKDFIKSVWKGMVDELRDIWKGMPSWFKDVCEQMREDFNLILGKLTINLDVVLKQIKLPSPEEMATQINKSGWSSKIWTAEDVQKARENIDAMLDPWADQIRQMPEVTRQAVEQSNKELKRLGEGKEWQAAETFFGTVKEWEGYSGKSKKTQKEAEKAGKSTESALNRWRSMMDTLDKEIARASDNSIAQIDAWSSKFYNDLMQIAAKGKGLISQEEMWQGITKVNQAVTDKLTDLWEDYTKWYAQNTNDRIAALDIERREITQKYTDIKNRLEEYQAALAKTPAAAPPGVSGKVWEQFRQSLIDKVEALKKLLQESEIQIPIVFDTKDIKETQTMIQNAAEAYKEQLSALKGVIPNMGQQAKLGLQIVQLENKIADSKYIQEEIDRRVLIRRGQWTEQDERQVKALQEQVKYYKEIQAIVEDLKTGTAGIGGLFAAWSYERMKDVSTRAYESFKEIMDDIERDISDAISAGIIDALRGKESDFSEVFFSMAEKGIKRAVDGLVTTMFDQLAGWGLGFFGKGFAAKPDGTEQRPYWVTLKIGKIGAGAESSGFFGPLLGGGAGGGMGGFEYPAGFNPTEAGYGGFPIEGQEALQQNAVNFYNQQANWFTNLLGLTSGPQSGLMSNTSGFYNQQTGFFQNLLGQLPGWLGKLGGVIGSLFDSLIKGIGGIFSGGGGGGAGLLGGLLGGIFSGGGGGIGTGAIGSAIPLQLPMLPMQHGGFVRKPTFALVGEGGAEWVIPDKKMKEMFGQDFTKSFINLLRIPAFSEGGYVTKPTLAMIGERGPELAIPERKLASMQNLVSSNVSSDNRQENITINAPTIIKAPEPARYFASRVNIEAERVHYLRKALRNL